MTNQSNILKQEEQLLPKSIIDKAIKSGNEFGWKQQDFSEAVKAAKQNHLGIIGGQVQYVLPDGTCDLYWLSYDLTIRKINETWLTYCDRTAKECLDKFNTLIATTDIEKEALTFTFLSDKKKNGVDISEYQTFILYFDDKETDLFDKTKSELKKVQQPTRTVHKTK